MDNLLLFRSTILTIVLLTLAVPGLAQESTYSRAHELYRNGQFEQAIDLLQGTSDPESLVREEALLLGHLLLTHQNDEKAAEDIIHRARDQYPDDILFQSLDLLHRYKNPPLLLPNVHIGRIRNAARRILKEAPADGIAHLVLGSLDADRFTALRHAVSMPGFSESSLDGVNIAMVEPIYVEDRNRKNIEYQARGLRHEREVNAVSRSEAAGTHYDAAVLHLEAAIEALPVDKEAYRILAEVFVVNESYADLLELSRTLQASRPWDVDGLLYEGLSQYYLNRYDSASTVFNLAIARLPANEADIFTGVETILSKRQQEYYETDAEGFSQTFWLLNDPRYLTGYNERSLEHYSRLVYSDIRFGGMFRDTRGWETEPGQVIVRYGKPSGETRISTKTDSYMMLVYPEFGFRFMDLAKAGKFTFFSPKVSGAPSFEAIRRAWNDDTIRSAEIFNESPQISRYDVGGRHVEPEYNVAYFRDESTAESDVIVSVSLPPDLMNKDADVESGIFLLKDGDMMQSVSTVDGSSTPTSVVSHTVTSTSGTGILSIEYEGGPDGSVGFGKEAIDVPSFNTSPAVSSLLVADLVEEVGRQRPSSGLYRNGHEIVPNVDHLFERGAPLYVYFEIYNLVRKTAGDHAYLVEAFLIEDRKERGVDHALKRLRRRNTGRGVAVSFESAIPYPNDALYLVVDTDKARSGPHILAIRIIDQTTENSAYSAIPIELQ